MYKVKYKLNITAFNISFLKTLSVHVVEMFVHVVILISFFCGCVGPSHDSGLVVPVRYMGMY